MTAPADIYAVASGQPIYGGRTAPSAGNTFDSLSYTDLSGAPTSAQNGLVFVVELHGSSGSNYKQNGRQYRAAVSGSMALPGTSTIDVNNLDFDSHNTFGFSTVYAYDTSVIPSGAMVKIRPIDKWYNDANQWRESAHCGFKLADGKVHLISERRYDAMMSWADANLTQYDHNKRVLCGGSMGAWGTASYGVRRYAMFAALYPDRPRWKHDTGTTTFAVSEYANTSAGGSGFVSTPIASSPLLVAEDGGTSYAAYLDMIAYVSNTANKVRWIGWCLGRNDGYASFQDSIDMVDALRTTKRGFAFAWNNGDHGTGSIMNQITNSYPYGTFRRDQGYPLFTEHSLDQDPKVDLVGGINLGLSFRNVVETASGWSCQVTNILNACTVKVEPISDVFKAAVAKQLVTIPAAGTWVSVSFTA